MKYAEITGDLFSEENINSDTYFAQCISADFGMGKGIAVEFNKRFDTKRKVWDMFDGNVVHAWDGNGADGEPQGACFQTDRVLNLVTKRNYWGKPTYETLTQALISMREVCEEKGIKKVAMPQIGCGLDRLEWGRVSDIIRQVFQDTDIEITVCKLKMKDR